MSYRVLMLLNHLILRSLGRATCHWLICFHQQIQGTHGTCGLHVNRKPLCARKIICPILHPPALELQSAINMHGENQFSEPVNSRTQNVFEKNDSRIVFCVSFLHPWMSIQEFIEYSHFFCTLCRLLENPWNQVKFVDAEEIPQRQSNPSSPTFAG
jgi:hypothetical protein